MPRKNARPAAKKAAKRKAKQIANKANPSHHAVPRDMAAQGLAMATFAGAAARAFDMKRDFEADRIIEANLDALYET